MIKISELIKNNLLAKNQNIKIVNEHSFEVFSRISSVESKPRCVFLVDDKYVKNIDFSVVMVITTEELYDKNKQLWLESRGVCITDNPKGLYFELLSQHENTNVIKKKTVIGKNCKISKNCVISEYNVVIGNNVVVEDYVVINENVIIGNNVTIQAGTKIGAQDLNVYTYCNQVHRLKHNGSVLIGNNVYINCNCVIGQALYAYGTTVISDDVMIGADVIIGHNSFVGEKCEFCGGAQLGGWVIMGSNCFVGMKACIKNAITVGNGAFISMGSMVIRNVRNNTKVLGNPAKRIDF